MTTKTLEEHTANALVDGNIGSAELSSLITEIEAAALVADQNAAAERAKAVDVVRSPNTEAAQRAVAQAILTQERWRASLAKLRGKLAEVLKTEAKERWLVKYNRLKQRRDEAAAEFRRYPEFSNGIVRMFALAADVDREIDLLNSSAPYGVHQRLRYVENEARNTELSRDRPSLAATTELRDWDNSGRMLWPQRHFGSLAADFARSMIPAAVGQPWSEPEVRAERRREIEQLQGQLSDFYQQATEMQEGRVNREPSERMGAPDRAR